MMNWRDWFSEIEKDFGFHKPISWTEKISTVEEFLERYPNDMQLHIRALYFLHNILVEEEYPIQSTEPMSCLLRKWFTEANPKFAVSAEYLFFVGKSLFIAEWFFGLNDTTQAIVFQEKAHILEPKRKLYKWAYYMAIGQEYQNLAKEILNNTEEIKWLKERGFPSEYVLEQLYTSTEIN